MQKTRSKRHVKPLNPKQKLRLYIILLSTIALACVLAAVLSDAPTAVAIAAALMITALLFILPLIKRTRKEIENTERLKARARRDPNRLLPNDRGKVLQFPGKKR